MPFYREGGSLLKPPPKPPVQQPTQPQPQPVYTPPPAPPQPVQPVYMGRLDLGAKKPYVPPSPSRLFQPFQFGQGPQEPTEPTGPQPAYYAGQSERLFTPMEEFQQDVLELKRAGLGNIPHMEGATDYWTAMRSAILAFYSGMIPVASRNEELNAAGEEPLYYYVVRRNPQGEVVLDEQGRPVLDAVPIYYEDLVRAFGGAEIPVPTIAEAFGVSFPSYGAQIAGEGASGDGSGPGGAGSGGGYGYGGAGGRAGEGSQEDIAVPSEDVGEPRVDDTRVPRNYEIATWLSRLIERKAGRIFQFPEPARRVLANMGLARHLWAILLDLGFTPVDYGPDGFPTDVIVPEQYNYDPERLTAYLNNLGRLSRYVLRYLLAVNFGIGEIPKPPRRRRRRGVGTYGEV